jgi:hypothetical protein
MLSVNLAECRKQAHYAERHYAKCCYAECRYAEYRYAKYRGPLPRACTVNTAVNHYVWE